MLMICWFYCVPFAEFLYYSAGIIAVLFALLMLRRAFYNNRPYLRGIALVLCLCGGVKFFLADLYFSGQKILCDTSPALKTLACTRDYVQLTSFLGICGTLLAVSGFYLLHLRTRLSAQVSPLSPQAVNLRFWANMSLAGVALMAVWELMPWLGYLTVGSVPPVFNAVPWYVLGIVNTGLIYNGFWRAEACAWGYSPLHSRGRNTYTASLWTPKDTLWTALIFFVVTLILSYASNDLIGAK